ncbi:glycosyltransferase family 2 protein [Actinosynnema sp. NPDC059335]|uniref:glycosyltransferase family 2 protein n=1 Tax=Actinosynnema sp. NPDC059335 TaxID=3346804 RepID=UPI00367015AA
MSGRGTSPPGDALRRPAGGYRGLEAIAGPVADQGGAEVAVRFRPVVTGPRRRLLCLLVSVDAVAVAAFLGWLLPVTTSGGPWPGRACAVLVLVVESVRAVQAAAMWVFCLAARDPVPMSPPPGLRVAVLTTIVPASEPLDTVVPTLRAMRRLAYAGRVDVWVLDEGDDPDVRAAAARLGVRHFSRAGRPEYNRPSGPYRRRTKAGNHNAWRAEHESDYDVVAQVDPDHVPVRDFLARSLGYFRDPDVAYVVAPQVYGNTAHGFVPHAAAAQSYLFNGVVQRGGNGLGAPLLIGTNHLYRVRAWRQIGGYQDSLTEDHLTGMTVVATTNPATGRRWKGVYTPDVLAVGEGPVSWADYFNQQRRWAYGVWDIALHHSPRLMPRLAPRQRLAYALMQSFYPGAAACWLCGNAATWLCLLPGPAVACGRCCGAAPCSPGSRCSGGCAGSTWPSTSGASPACPGWRSPRCPGRCTSRRRPPRSPTGRCATR